jgi:hypothetical protein
LASKTPSGRPKSQATKKADDKLRNLKAKEKKAAAAISTTTADL